MFWRQPVQMMKFSVQSRTTPVKEVGLKKSQVGMAAIKITITVTSRSTLKFKSFICALAQRADLPISRLTFNVLLLT